MVQRRDRFLTRSLAAFLLLSLVARGHAETPVGVPQSQTVIDVLHQMSDRADVIFAGQVVAIHRNIDANSGNAGFVEVEFRVEQAVRGCSDGTTFVLREWGGLWVVNNQRYRVGQRLLMLLHAPSAAGMRSPVGGLDGAIPIRQGGQAGSNDDISTPPQPPFVDLRWLGARLQRSISYRAERAPSTAWTPLLTTESMVATGAPGSTMNVGPIVATLGNASSSDASVPAQQASVTAAVAMLTSWQRAQHAAP